MKKIIMTFIITSVFLGAASCTAPDELFPDNDFMSVTAVPDDFNIETRSRLPESSEFEDLISNINFLAYDDGTGELVSSCYCAGSELSVNIPKERTYHIFLLANMGDQTGKVPVNMKTPEFESFRYVIPGYEYMSANGIPMVCDIVTPWKSSLTLSLRRLLAKLEIRVDKSDIIASGGGGANSFRNTRLMVERVAKALYPFAPGGSRAKGADDLFTGSAVEQAYFGSADLVTSETLVLYVPENMQGTLLPEGTSSMDKSESNASLSGEDLCTYVQLEGVKDGTTDGVSGSLLYRFFPGTDKDQVSYNNFDLKGGLKYQIGLNLSWNGMYTTGNWKVERSGWSDSRQIKISREKDKSYTSFLIYPLARGSEGVPLYIFYSPHGEEYEAEGTGSPHHFNGGWGFKMNPYTQVMPNTQVLSNSSVTVGFKRHTDYMTEHYITIPKSAQAGHLESITYYTTDGLKNAILALNVVDPVIRYSPTSMEFAFSEYGYDSRRYISISSLSPVRPVNIEVYTNDSSLITLGTFDKETGSVYVYWNNTNTGSSERSATVYLTSESCEVTASCVLTQQAKGGLVIGGEEDGGGGDIDY